MAPLSDEQKPPISIDFRPDGDRIRVYMQDSAQQTSSPFFGLYTASPLTPKFAGKLSYEL
jgi:hypothetical protein